MIFELLPTLILVLITFSDGQKHDVFSQYYQEIESLSENDDLFGTFNPNLNTNLIEKSRDEDDDLIDRRRHLDVFGSEWTY